MSENIASRGNANVHAFVAGGFSKLLTDDASDGGGFFRALVEALPVAVYTTDAQGRITYYNQAAANLWGRAPKLGEDWWCGSWRLFWPDGKAMAHEECPMAIALKTGQPVRGYEAIAERPDGSRFPFIPYPTPMFDPSGKLVGAVNMLVDISSATAEQTTGIGQINDAVLQLDQVTQQNAALVEESAAAAESLKQQAARLVNAVSVFRLGNSARAVPA